MLAPMHTHSGTRGIGCTTWLLLLSLGCQQAAAPGAPQQGAPAAPEQPAPAAPEPAAPEAPKPAAPGTAAAPPPDFEGNWFVLEPGQTLEAFAQSIGLPSEIVSARARQVDYRWLAEVQAKIEQSFPEVKEAMGGRIRLPRAGYSDTVGEGEDLWKLVERFKISALELLLVNGLGPDDAQRIQPGMRFVVPGIVRKATGELIRWPHPKEAAALERATALDLGKVGTASRLLFGHMEDSWLEAAGGSKPSGTINWPVAGGWFVRGFGSGEAAYHLAVDVAGPIGWPVRAVDSGIVAYVGDGIRGYGNIVMIIHPGGFVSFYAHLSAAFVYSGEQVARGEIIGEVGSTGISKGPHVHFELVHDGKNCNPEPLFRPGVRRRDGTSMDVAPLEWTEAGRPRGLKCSPRPRHHPSSQWVTNEDADSDADDRSGLKGK
jgi:murein DD-endopeptidase MepM/ murein hydrolase activator NlpD